MTSLGEEPYRLRMPRSAALGSPRVWACACGAVVSIAWSVVALLPRPMPTLEGAISGVVVLVGGLAIGGLGSRARRAAELARLCEGQRLQNALLLAISHDFRTPLASIVGAGTALLDYGEQLDPRSRGELLRSIVQEGDRLSHLLTNVLNMTRLEALESTMKTRLESLDDMVGSAISRIGERLGERLLDVRTPPETVLVMADAVLFEQLLINLLENCLRYTPERCPLEVCVLARGSEAELVVADRGPGVPAGDESRLFDKFYRGRAGGSNDGGMGLGLTICRAIASAHGGRIRAENRAGGGLSVSVTLPRVAAQPWPVTAGRASTVERQL